MVKKYRITFHETNTPIGEPITKFGGQPVWLTTPQWPLSRQTGNPMRFIGQVALDPAIFGEVLGQLVYIFMTDEEVFIDGTWDPDGGENAVIIQPGAYSGPTQPLYTGPSLYRMVGPPPGESLLVPEACEFVIEFHAGEDPEFVDDELQVVNDELIEPMWTDSERDTYYAQLNADPNKIGGTPCFLYNAQFPDEGTWQLILQLDAASVPFWVNFGDMGWGYAFLSDAGKTGKFLFQG